MEREVLLFSYTYVSVKDTYEKEKCFSFHIHTSLSKTHMKREVLLFSYTYVSVKDTVKDTYGVATVSRIDKITRLFCRIYSLLLGFFLHKQPIFLSILLNKSTPYQMF